MAEYQSTMTPEMREGLEKYLAGRADQRVREATVMFNNLTEREQQLVRQAAVMGWVQGVNAVPGGEDRRACIPRDNEILTTVLIECRNMGHIYPTLAALDPMYAGEEEEEDDDEG